MNYLTNYYKNRCEQLQEQINMLEANIRSASEIEQLGHETYKKALDRRERELGRKLTYLEVSAISDQILVPYGKRAERRERLLTRASAQLPVVAQSGDVETATQFADVMGDISKRNISGKVAGYRNFSPERAERMRSFIQGTDEIGKETRNLGGQTTVSADIPAMRKVVQMGKGRYQPPLPTPETMHVTPSQY
jgi:superfamily I DNA and/or RNA helicase